MEERSFRTSTVIRRVRYNEEVEELTIWFVSGNIYRYSRVPAFVWDGFSTAKSAGTYFNKHITGRYRYEEIAQQRCPITRARTTAKQKR